jgi:CysZ protein
VDQITQLFKQLTLGLSSFVKAVPFMLKHGLYFYIILPAAIMILVYKGGELIASRQTATEAQTMSEIICYVFGLLIDIAIGLMLMTFAKFIVVIVLSPLLAYLSERCETILTGNTYSFNLEQFWNDVKRALRLALRNIIRQYLIIIPLFIIAWLFWEDSTKSPVMWGIFLVSSYYYGFSFIDYINERRKLDFKKSIAFVRSHKGLAVSIGGCYAFMIFGPVDLGVIFSLKGYDPLEVTDSILRIGFHLFLWLIASAAPILAIIAATLAMHDLGYLKRKSDK